MLSKLAIILTCVTTCSVVPTTFSFQIGPLLHTNRHRYQLTTPLFEGVSDAEVETKGSTQLKFKANVKYSTNSLPYTSKDQIDLFFQSPENRALLTTAGGKRAWEEIKSTPQIMEEWEKVCDIVGAVYPDSNDVVLSVRTGGVDFPGLHVKSLAKIGVKLIENRYEFSFISDEREVSGFSAVVWIFNKLTGSGGDEKSGDQSTATKSLSVVSYTLTDDSKVVFTIDSELSLTVNFPTILLKILPTNKEKTEDTGGKAVTKTIEKDIAESMAKFEEAYLKSIN